MRLIIALNDIPQGQMFSTFLSNEGIENLCEISTNNDWGNADYGNRTCKIWIYEEDNLEQTLKWAEEFQQDPNNPRFLHSEKKTSKLLESIQTVIQEPSPQKPQFIPNKVKTLEKEPLGTITLYLLLICTFLFIFGEMTTPSYTTPPTSIPLTPLFTSPIKKVLFYDYPQAYEIIDKLAEAYGVSRLQNLNDLPEDGHILLEQYVHAPYWQGFYQKVLNFYQRNEPFWNFTTPMFEKIHEGEIWRLFTPALLHSDIFHIFFNMIWLIIFGRQIEQRVGALHYILFLLLTGVFSNTAQYLMGGANFIGFSGILCAMLTFIWARQKIAPWEGYQLQSSTVTFLLCFISILFSIQMISFFLEVYTNTSISPGIANTAHLSGAFIGYILGRMQLFAWRNS